MDDTQENLAQTLARELPAPSVLFIDQPGPSDKPEGSVTHVALPKGFAMLAIDNEKLLANPRRAVATATLADDESFCAYVNRHAELRSAVWCTFNPVTYAVSFTAVFDEHFEVPGWREHKATFTPTLSQEWQLWTRNDKQSKSQVAFAEFLEQNEPDIAALDGYPTSLQMMAMAQNFEARQDQRIKSSVRLQNGGIQLEYVADADHGTIERMSVFDKFCIGIPVFWTVPRADAPEVAYRVKARLRYRVKDGAVTFHYELIRPDQTHQSATLALIAAVKAGIGSTPLLMGACG